MASSAALRGRPTQPFTTKQTTVGRATSRRVIAPRAGLLDFLTPPAKTVAGRGRASELVDEILELSDGSDGGIKVTPAQREAVEELVDELEAYCPKAPLRSELIFGKWLVVYASKPQTAGGPFRSPVGRVVFPDQKATQIIAPPNLCVNEVSYKALGFVPGAARQEGELEPIDERTFQLTFPGLDGKRAGGPPLRVIETVYLDERIRVARAIPQEEGKEGSFYVFKRIDAVADEDEEEVFEEEEEEEVVAAKKAPLMRMPWQSRSKDVVEDEEEEEEKFAPAPSRPSLPKFSLPGTQIFSSKKPGMATQAERAYEERTGGRARPAAAAPVRSAGAKTASGTQVRKSREELAAERAAIKAAAEEERERAREAAAAAKAAAEEERRQAREAAEAERVAAAERRNAAREQYQELMAEATEAATEARDAASAVKTAERESAALLRAAAQARSVIARAASAVESAMQELAEVREAQSEVATEAKNAKSIVAQLEKQLKQMETALAPRVAGKR